MHKFYELKLDIDKYAAIKNFIYTIDAAKHSCCHAIILELTINIKSYANLGII